MKEIDDLSKQLKMVIIERYGGLPREVVEFFIELRRWVSDMEEKDERKE